MRFSRLFGLLLAALLGASLLSVISATSASAVDPRNDHTRLPRNCATQAQEVPHDAIICKLTPYRENRPTLMLWGDSHVWMQIPGFLKAAKNRNINVISSLMGSCPPMDPGLSWKDRYQKGICAASNTLALRTMNDLANGPQPFKLVLAGNWEMYERLIQLANRGGKPGPGKDYPFAQSKIFKTGGPRLFRKLGQMGVDVDVVHQVARAPAKGKPCQRMDPYACNFPRHQAFRSESSTKRWLTRLTSPARPDEMINVNNHLCSGSTCFGKIRGVWTFHDNSHITASMARQLSPYYAGSVADLVSGTSAQPPAAPVDSPCTVPVLCR